MSLAVLVCWTAWAAVAQQTATAQVAASASNAVPNLINFSSVLTDINGKALNGVTGVTFLLYKDQQGGPPLWLETQNVIPGKGGQYTATLGSTTSHGLPPDVFATGEARWLAVQVVGQQEQPRVLLVAVPYALKAGDAQTIGGLPPSAFVLATPGSIGGVAAGATGATASSPSDPAPPPSSSVTTTGGTVNALPLWTTGTNIQSSALTQTGSGATAKVGINTTTPGATLEVKGATIIGGLLSLPPTVAATAASGAISQPENMAASAFNSTKKAPVNQTFQWKAEPVGNNTANPSATMNLLFGSGTAPAETGFHIAGNGRITFASGQTFPGTGTITGVTTATGGGLAGGGSSGTLNLSLTHGCAANQILQWSGSAWACSASGTGTITGVSPGLGLAGGGTSGVVTLGIDPAQVPQLGAANTFNASQSINGSLSIFQVGAPPSAALSVGTYVNTAITASSGESVGISATGGTSSQGSQDGQDGVYGQGGPGSQDPKAFASGGPGVFGLGGMAGSGVDGSGGVFQGGGNCCGDGVDAYPSGGTNGGFAGFFSGNIWVTGAITAGTKDFKIDHPLDPGNKYLVHASVESSEMMNIYTGNVTTDAQGEATVQLPEWFEVLNADFRYQLTVIGQFAQAIVAREIQDHAFTIRTSVPGVKVSWQVTGVRQDAFAKAHPLVVEEEKDTRLRGFYIHPELYGAPDEKQIEWARHPQMMKKMKQNREKQARLRASAKPN